MKKMKKFLIASMCVAAMGAVIVPVTGTIRSGKAEDTLNWDEITIATDYNRGDTITIPECDLSVNGTSYDSVIKLKYPGGATTTIESGDFTLSQPGQYTLIYEALCGTVTHKNEKKFLVADQLWSVGSDKSEIKYGKVGSTNAMMVKLARNDTLSFNKIIDLSDLKATDTLIKGFVNPEIPGTFEFDKMTFMLTDASDPTQTLTIRGTRSTTNNQRFVAYWTSAGPNQTLGGWDANTNGGVGGFSTTAPDGIRGTAVTNTSFYSENGTYSKEYVSGCYSWPVTADQCPFSISFDKNTVQTFVNKSFVADLDNVEYYANEPIWKGFPSNKVFLTVQAQDCSGETANFCLSDVYGYEFGEDVENVFAEKDPPEITIDIDEKYLSYENGSYMMTPLAVKGGYYPVPVATAYDTYAGNLKVETKVYHNYHNEENRVERPIKNNTFLVNKAGDYAIVYEATDFMGNTTKILYWIQAVDALENPLALTLDKANAKTSGVCGEQIAIATPTATGGSGDVVITTTATCGDVTLDASNGYFIPEQAGTWTITCVAKDFSGIKVTESYTVTVDWGTKPIFVDEPILPKYIVSNIEYIVPTVIAYDYSSQTKVECVADMILKDSTGTNKTYKAGEKFKPIATEEDSVVTLTFTAGGAEYSKELPALLPIEEKGNGRTSVYIEKMFIPENLTVARTQNGLRMTAAEAGNANWEFGNPIVAENASVTVKGIQGSSNFSAMKVTFTDSVDKNVAVTMIVKSGENGRAFVDFGSLEDREMNKGFNLGKNSNGEDMDVISFSYELGRFYVDQLESVVTVDNQGKAFNGFPSGRIYISTEVVDAQAGAEYLLTKFDNHIMNNGTTDRTPPRVAIVGEYGGMYNKNDIYHIAPALASDTLYADITATVSVRTPKGEIVSDVNGLALENVPADRVYDIKLTEYGQYQVKYVASDLNREGDIAHTINVFDKKAPKLVVVGAWSETVKLGETVTLPELAAEDDSSTFEEMKVFRYVRNPYGKAVSFGQDYAITDFGEVEYYEYKFTFNNVGTYTFINVAYDAAGNQKLVEYTVTVEA